MCDPTAVSFLMMWRNGGAKIAPLLGLDEKIHHQAKTRHATWKRLVAFRARSIRSSTLRAGN
jgi:hypothetical protein